MNMTMNQPPVMISLATSGMIVNVEVNVWSATKQDQTISKEVTTAHNADDKAARVVKHLLAGDPTHKKLLNHRQTIYNWMTARPAFLDQYVRAREEQAESMADEIVAIADETPETAPVFDKDGNQLAIKLDSSYIQWQKNRIDARKWTAAKLRPKKYGDRIVHAGDDENPVVLENNLNVFGELLKSMKMARQAE
jgi:hypothetical protein